MRECERRWRRIKEENSHARRLIELCYFMYWKRTCKFESSTGCVKSNRMSLHGNIITYVAFEWAKKKFSVISISSSSLIHILIILKAFTLDCKIENDLNHITMTIYVGVKRENMKEQSSSIIMIHNFISFNATLSKEDFIQLQWTFSSPPLCFIRQCTFLLQPFPFISLSVYISFNNSFSFFNDYYDVDERMREKIVTITSYVAFSSNCLRKNYFLLFAYTHYDYDYEDDDEDDEEIEGNFHIYYSFVVIIGAWICAFICWCYGLIIRVYT